MKANLREGDIVVTNELSIQNGEKVWSIFTILGFSKHVFNAKYNHIFVVGLPTHIVPSGVDIESDSVLIPMDAIKLVIGHSNPISDEFEKSLERIGSNMVEKGDFDDVDEFTSSIVRFNDHDTNVSIVDTIWENGNKDILNYLTNHELLPETADYIYNKLKSVKVNDFAEKFGITKYEAMLVIKKIKAYSTQTK